MFSDLLICCLYEAKLQYETFDDSFGEGDWVLTVFTALSTVSFPWDIFFQNTAKYWIRLYPTKYLLSPIK